MSKGSTLYRFRISLSDVDRSAYEELDFRVSMHSSETEQFLLTRILAYALNFEDGLEFSQGLANPDEPAIRMLGTNGEIVKWIDIGNPTPKRLHKASKASRSVRIYTYKDPEGLIREVAGEDIHRAGEIEVYSIPHKFLDTLIPLLERDNEWGVIHSDGELTINIGEDSYATSIGRHQLGS